MTTASRGSGAQLTLGSCDSLRQALKVMTLAFESAGLSSASADARFLLQGVLSLDAAAVIRNPDQAVGAKVQTLADAARRRMRHEPVSRILGTREFYGRPFRVTPDVLDPRPDTECLIDLALDILRAEGRSSAALAIADIGTGSGAIITTLLAELPNAIGTATDISKAALAIAAENAAALGVGNRLTLVETNALEGVKVPFDVIVSNPPYIPTGEIAALELDVKDYDPHVALDGGRDGLRVYREIARDISSFEFPCWVILEVGTGQAESVEEIFTVIGGLTYRRRIDLGGHTRAVALQIHR